MLCFILVYHVKIPLRYKKVSGCDKMQREYTRFKISLARLMFNGELVYKIIATVEGEKNVKLKFKHVESC